MLHVAYYVGHKNRDYPFICGAISGTVAYKDTGNE